jgi:competence protein ComEA
VGLIAWWLVHGGWAGRLVEINRAKPRSARFQVDVNRADWPELAQLPGIGEVLARGIVESRRTQGPFRHLDELLRVRGIGPKKLEGLRPYLRPLAEQPAAGPATRVSRSR